MKSIQIFTVVILLVSLNAFSQEKTPAFPTAEGFGMWATGGRGGKVVEVTTTDDDGTPNLVGSFRWALKQYSGEPITIVFKVSGIIDLKGIELRSKRNNITIAGQTAPGDGICIKGESVNFGGSFNMIVRHLRFRTGAYTSTGAEVNAASVIHENGGNFIYDHCSMSWSSEELCDFADDDNITVQWCIFSEGLYNSINSKGARGYGPVLAGEGASYHHNLIAHNVSRSPRFGVSTTNDIHMLVDYVNNVNYNFGKATACYGGENEMGENGSVKINMVNNYYKQGPAYPDTRSAYFIRASYEVGLQGTAYSHWHLSGNYITGTTNQKLNVNNYSGVHFEEYTEKIPTCTIDDLKSDHHQVPYPVNTEKADSAFNRVIQQSGAFPRDTIDRRISYEAYTGTASRHGSFNNHALSGIIDSPEDAGGWPEYKTYNTASDNDHDGIADYWEVANAMDTTNANDRNNISPEGYTYLEVYLNGLVGEYLNGYKYPAQEIKDTLVSGIKESFDQELNAYFDHTRNYLVIESNEIIKGIYIYNLQGEIIILYQHDNKSHIDISSLKNGIYIAHVVTEKNKTTRIKFIKT